MNILDKKIKLLNGVEIPILGLGTWLIEDKDASEAVRQAIKLGYRHIDTAQAYGNEKGVGEGIKASGVDRSEIFIQTKVAAEIKDYETARKSILESLKKLDCGYIDLMIIHSPEPWDKFRQGDHYFEGNLEVWRALEEFYEAGLIKAIGVSNFEEVDIENILKHCKVKPMVNQVWSFISNTPFELVKYCQKQGIVFEAYSPIAHGRLLDDKKVGDMAKKYGVTIPQLCIRYTLQLGMVSLPKTVHPEYMKANADVDFEISLEDMKILMDMDKDNKYGSVEEFGVLTKI